MLTAPLLFSIDQFSYDPNTCTYTAEASTLGLRPGQVLRAFSMMRGNERLVFNHTSTDKDSSGEDVTGWRYKAGHATNALIIND